MNDQNIVDIIAAHRCRERGMVCDEGEVWCDGCREVVNVDDVAAHQLDALRDNGIAVVELPEPDNGRNGQWLDATIFASKNNVFLDVELGQVERWTPSEARTRAAALLAAADYAERDQC